MRTVKVLLLIALICYGTDSVFAQHWIQTSAPNTNWQSLATSADGNNIVAILDVAYNPESVFFYPAFSSTNSGITWLLSESLFGINAWNCIASSANGETLLAAPDVGPLYVSTNSGTFWLPNGPQDPPGIGQEWFYWNAVASSGDGSHLIAVAMQSSISDGLIYTSSDSGATWVGPYTGLNACSSVASSADGNIIIAGIMDDSIHISTNAGTSWFATDSPIALSWSVACSADGGKIIAANCLNDGGVYTSADSGNTWVQTPLPDTNWISVASSADGTKLVAAGNSILSVMDSSMPANYGLIYTSTNSGASWTATDAPCTNWISVASSADGNKLAAAVKGGGIWVCQTTPSPCLKLQSANGNLKCSWVVPSTNFILQLSTDLISWTEITNVPTLNLTNLMNELVLSPTKGNSFYRLTTP